MKITFKVLNDDNEWTYLNIFKHELDEVKAIIILFDVTNESSFITAKSLINYIQNMTSIFINIFLVGNKCDLILDSIISTKEVFEFIKDKECIYYKEISCKDQTNLNDLLTYLEEGLVYECSPQYNKLSTKDTSLSCLLF
jgi:GTPase SAR1 family protein